MDAFHMTIDCVQKTDKSVVVNANHNGRAEEVVAFETCRRHFVRV